MRTIYKPTHRRPLDEHDAVRMDARAAIHARITGAPTYRGRHAATQVG